MKSKILNRIIALIVCCSCSSTLFISSAGAMVLRTEDLDTSGIFSGEPDEGNEGLDVDSDNSNLIDPQAGEGSTIIIPDEDNTAESESTVGSYVSKFNPIESTNSLEFGGMTTMNKREFKRTTTQIKDSNTGADHVISVVDSNGNVNNNALADIKDGIMKAHDDFMTLYNKKAQTDNVLLGLVTDYTKALIYFDWFTNNFWVELGDETETGEETWGRSYSVFTLPVGDNGKTYMSEDEYVEMYNAISSMGALLCDPEVYPETNNDNVFGAGKDDALKALPVVSNLDIAYIVEGRGDIHSCIEEICKNYFDAGVLYFLAKDATLDTSAAGSWSNAQSYDDLKNYGSLDSSNPLSGLKGEYWSFTSADDANAEERAKLIRYYLRNSKYYKEINSYMSVIREITALLGSVNGRALKDIELDGKKYGGLFKEQTVDNAIYGCFSDVTHMFLEEAPDVLKASENLTTNSVENIDVNNGVFGLMVHEGRLVDGKIEITGDEARLSNIGFNLLATGVIYNPFTDIAGNDTWLEMVQEFIDSDTDKDSVAKIVQVAFNTKKPLYVTDGTVSSWAEQEDLSSIESADYRYAFLADVLQIEEDITRSYAVVKGSMTPSKVDGNTWEYVNKNSKLGSSTNTTQQVTVENQNTSANSPNLDENSTNTVDLQGAITTTGSETLFGSAYQMTEPVMITSGMKTKWVGGMAKGYAAAVGGLTSIILHNAAADAKDNVHIQNADKEMLFLNGMGDIVLDDGTIVLPAIANPVLYKYTTSAKINKSTALGDNKETEIMKFAKSIMTETDYKAYYPYNASVMNHYPTARVKNDNELAVETVNDENKYMMMITSDRYNFVGDISNTIFHNLGSTWDMKGVYAKKLETVNKSTKKTTVARLGSVRCAHVLANSFRVTGDSNLSVSVLQVAKGSGGVTWADRASMGIINFDGASTRNNMIFVTRGRVSDENHMSFFPLYNDSAETKESFKNLAKPLITSCLRYIARVDEATGRYVDAETLELEKYIYDFVGEGLLGTQYASTLVKSTQISYEEMVNDQSGRFLKFLIQIANSAMNSLGKIDGVLAIKGPYENMFFNVIFNFIQDFYLLIAVALLVIVASKFFKGHFNMLYVCFIAFLCVAGFEVYANWLPTLLPQLYNFAVNDSIENVVWHTTFYNAESYKETYKNPDNVDPATGKLQPYTGTINLYQLTNAEMHEVAKRNGIDLESLRTGDILKLDEDAGIFVQGNMIKMSVDKLLAINSMRGLYQSQWELLGEDYTGTSMENLLLEPIPAYNGNPYSIQLIEPVVSLEAYYTPYDHFERAFLSQLNQFATLFNIERNIVPYGSGEIYKDSFLVQAYLWSGIFTAPGDDDVLANSVVPDTITKEYNEFSDVFDLPTTADFVKEVNKRFAPAEDWLGLVKVFAEPDQGIKNSLWGYVMQSREWYNNSWEMTPKGDEKLNDMIRYINTQTKQWVIKNIDNLSYCSDENAVKMISLYATTCFTHYISEVGQWMYPNYINAADIELSDVLYGSMVSLKDKNFAYDGTVVNTVGLNIGIFGVIFLILILVFSSLFIFVTTYTIPILYALFGIIIIFRLVNREGHIGLIKGYTKVTFASIILYFLFSLVLQVVELGGYRWYSYMICTFLLFLLNYFLFWVVFSVVTDLGELGNNTLTANLVRGLDKLTRNAFSRIVSNSANIYNTRRTNIKPKVAYQYGRTYNVDDYDRPYSHRTTIQGGNDYGAPDDYMRSNTHSGYGRNDHYEDTLGQSRSSRDGMSSNERRGWS